MSGDKQRRFYGRWTILNSSDWLTCVGWKTSGDCSFELHSPMALTASGLKGNRSEGLGLTLRWMCLWWKEISALESILLHFAGVLALSNANTMQLFFRCAEESRLKRGGGGGERNLISPLEQILRRPGTIQKNLTFLSSPTIYETCVLKRWTFDDLSDERLLCCHSFDLIAIDVVPPVRPNVAIHQDYLRNARNKEEIYFEGKETVPRWRTTIEWKERRVLLSSVVCNSWCWIDICLDCIVILLCATRTQNRSAVPLHLHSEDERERDRRVDEKSQSIPVISSFYERISIGSDEKDSLIFS